MKIWQLWKMWSDVVQTATFQHGLRMQCQATWSWSRGMKRFRISNRCRIRCYSHYCAVITVIATRGLLLVVCYSWFARGDASLLLFPSFELFSAGHFEGSRRASGHWKSQAEEIQLFRLISLEIAGLQAWTGWARGLIQVQEKLETRCQHGLKMLETWNSFCCFCLLSLPADYLWFFTFGPGERSSHRDGCAAGATWYPTFWIGIWLKFPRCFLVEPLHHGIEITIEIYWNHRSPSEANEANPKNQKNEYSMNVHCITRLRLEEQMAEIQSVLEGKDRPRLCQNFSCMRCSVNVEKYMIIYGFYGQETNLLYASLCYAWESSDLEVFYECVDQCMAQKACPRIQTYHQLFKATGTSLRDKGPGKRSHQMNHYLILFDTIWVCCSELQWASMSQ